MTKKFLTISFFLTFFDQIIKLIVTNFLKLGNSITIIPSFFKLTYVQNEGAAWSIFEGNRIFLILVSLVSLILIYFFLIKNKQLKQIESISYSILIGGLFGNLIDRISLGYVIDYLDFTIFNYPFPIFNFADICIVISVFLLLLINIKEEKNDFK